MTASATPKHLKEIEAVISEKLMLLKKPCSEVFETQQLYYDLVLQIYQEALKKLIDKTITYSKFLNDVREAYEKAIQIRDERISQFITQDLKDEKFSDYLCVMRERDARYTLYFENLGLQLKLKELGGSSYSVEQAYGDPVVLRIALDRCREQLSSAQTELTKLRDEYADTVPRREFDSLEARQLDVSKALAASQAELKSLQDNFNKMLAKKKSIEEELFECKERCSELERAGTPRPHWEICGDFISGGRDRWWQLASGLTSREILRVLLKELGPAAESDHLEYFDGLGTEEAVPPYLRWAGRVRNLRLSRRELCVLANDIWRAKEPHKDMPMHDYLTHYFEDRYQQPSMRAEWAYNLCAGAEQALDEPQLRIFLGALRGPLHELAYWSLRDQWRALRDNLYAHTKGGETVTLEELEKVCKATFPLKSEVDVRSLAETARRQLKLRLNAVDLHLDKLFLENEEGFLRSDVSRELYRQRAAAQERYLRELVAALGGRRARDKPVSVDALKRALAIVDPAIDHIRMERYVRWAFGAAPDGAAPVPVPLRRLAARLAAGDLQRAGPRAPPRTNTRHQ